MNIRQVALLCQKTGVFGRQTGLASAKTGEAIDLSNLLKAPQIQRVRALPSGAILGESWIIEPHHLLSEDWVIASTETLIEEAKALESRKNDEGRSPRLGDFL